MSPEDRAGATVYTSGEHCPMCAAAHGWVRLGRIVYASSSAQLGHWLAELDVPAPRCGRCPSATSFRIRLSQGRTKSWPPGFTSCTDNFINSAGLENEHAYLWH